MGNNVGFLPQRGDRLRVRVPICLPRPYLNRPRDLVQHCCAPFVCWRERGEKTAMKEQGIQINAVRCLKCACGGIRVRTRREDGGLWDERSEDGLEEVACGKLGMVDEGGRGGQGVGVGLVGVAGL
jgi:hypothetical protein